MDVTRRISVIEDPRFRNHIAPDGHPEAAPRLLAVGQALSEWEQRSPDTIDRMSPRYASDEEILRILDKIQLTIPSPGPTMIRTDKTPHLAFSLTHQTLTAVLTNIIKGFDTAIILPHHQNRFRAHLFLLPIAGVGYFIFTAQYPPYAP